MNNPNDVAQIKHLDSLASHVNVLGSASSTVDGGLWFEVVDGLPIVKMNHGGSTFTLDTRPADDALIGNKLYLGGHIFKLTGFVDGLTFSDNNFYVADNLVGSVSNFAFQFTDAATLSVAEGGTTAITQLDTDVVDFSFDVLELNPLPAPKIYVGTMTDSSTFGGYTKLAVSNYKAQWTTKLPAGGVYLLTSSTGRVSAVSYPAATGALARYRGNTEASNKKPYGSAAPSADIIADLGETPRYWNLTCPVPDPDNPDCLGKFVFVIDATDTHSSVILTINVTGVE